MVKRDDKALVINPEILDQVEVEDQYTADQRSMIAKENVSSVCSHIYAAATRGRKRIPPIKGGQVKMVFPWPDPVYPRSLETRELRPDIAHLRRTGRGFTEVKASSGHSLQYKCAARQFESYAFALAFRRYRGDEIPWIDYAFARYGNRNTNGQHRHENGTLIKAIAEAEKRIVVAPFNLATFFMMVSPEKHHNQESTRRPIERGYWIVRGGLLTAFLEHDSEKACEDAVKNAREILDRRSRHSLIKYDWEAPLARRLEYLSRPRNLRQVIADLSLEGLTREDSMAPKMRTYAGDPIAPFPITRFRIPHTEYQKWLDSLMDDKAR
ncbi:MAG: hypothetical protein KKE05_01470, partial [Nanoarchaeota archaeon]|nr:hypothetical protein [Nanoarchaeota archaeon]